MELKWSRSALDSDKRELRLYNHHRVVGWVRLKETGFYRCHLSAHLGREVLFCETQEYVTLREAMRALKSTVTVILIGEIYGTQS